MQVYKITEGPENVFPQSASVINDLLHNLNFVSFISKEISVFVFFVRAFFTDFKCSGLGWKKGMSCTSAYQSGLSNI